MVITADIAVVIHVAITVAISVAISTNITVVISVAISVAIHGKFLSSSPFSKKLEKKDNCDRNLYLFFRNQSNNYVTMDLSPFRQNFEKIEIGKNITIA